MLFQRSNGAHPSVALLSSPIVIVPKDTIDERSEVFLPWVVSVSSNLPM